MSVKLNITGSCAECEYIDLELDYFRADTFNAQSKKIYTLNCKHEPTCYHIQREHEESMKAVNELLSELCGE